MAQLRATSLFATLRGRRFQPDNWLWQVSYFKRLGFSEEDAWRGVLHQHEKLEANQAIKEVPASGTPYFELASSAGFSGRPSFDLYGREAPQVITVGAELCLNVASTQAGGGGGDDEDGNLPKHRLRRIQRSLSSESSARELRAKINQLLTAESRRVLGASWSILFLMTCREWAAHRIQEVLVRDRATKLPPRPSRRQWTPNPMTHRNLQRAVRARFVTGEIFSAALNQLVARGRVEESEGPPRVGYSSRYSIYLLNN